MVGRDSTREVGAAATSGHAAGWTFHPCEVLPRGVIRATLFPRDKTTFSYINMDGDALVGPQDPDDGIAVPFRAGPGTSGVVDIQRLEQILRTNPKTKAATGADDGLDAAEYALQLIRFPYRQVFGADEGITLAKAFRATIAYQEHVSTTFRFGGNP